MSKSAFVPGRGKKQAVPDKVDMSLDDIIRLNRREQQSRKRQAAGNRPVLRKGRLAQRKPSNAALRAAGPVQRGGGALRGGMSKLRSRRILPQTGRRRGQGVAGGFAARRPVSLQKGLIPVNRTAYNQRTGQKARPFFQHGDAQYKRPEVQRRPYRQAEQQRNQRTAAPVRRPFQLRRRPPPPAHPAHPAQPVQPVQQAQREARQATFLFRRGLKVHTQVQKPNPRGGPARTRQWRTQANSSGILTVSIDNPTARTQPEPPTAWSLHPPPPAAVAPIKTETVEKKPPKGVPLQFDINSVGKPQTAMTLNERFRILKDQRVATQNNKGSRFVTVS